MSTRSVIAYGTEERWIGVYHHSGGYPRGVGKTIWDLLRDKYKGNIRKFVDEVIESHPHGWVHLYLETVIKRAPNTVLGWRTKKDSSQCFCHGYLAKRDGNDPKDKSHMIHYPDCIKDPQQRYNNCLRLEYVYILDVEKVQMVIWTSYDTGKRLRVEGTRGNGSTYSYDSIEYAWGKVALLDLNGEEPDWNELSERGPTKI